VNPERIVKEIILKLNDKWGRSSVYLSIPPDLSEFQWDDSNFEDLIKQFLDHMLDISYSDCPVRMAVHEMKQKTDLERFFSISPEYWLNLSVECQANTGAESGAKKILEGLGYQCSEWIGVEDSESQLGAFHLEAIEKPALILFVQNRGAKRKCDFLIPVANSAIQNLQPTCSCS
jgi:hypothetical protein